MNSRFSAHLQMKDGEKPCGLQMVTDGKILTVTVVVEVDTEVRIGRLMICQNKKLDEKGSEFDDAYLLASLS